ncbi:hypothetical protein K5549_000135 [Capra hircus]|nr:hypothetical protein K5549_000135 [Capra hircus]
MPVFLISLLSYVTELTDRVRARSSPDVDGVEDSADFVSFFPDFVWTLRDFSLDLKADGESITADEYLENSLKLKKGTSSKDTTFNLPRLCIRKFFPKKKCFISDWPIHRKKLGQLEELCDDELDSEFVQQPAVFCSYIFSNSKTKTLSGGIKVDGPLENAVLVLGEIENSAAVQKAIAQNDQQMSQKLQLPSETLQELLDLHRASEKEATEVFMKSSFKDIDQLFQKELAAEEILQEYLKSKESVTDAILQTDQTLSEKEKLIEAEHVKAESVQAAAKMLEEMQIRNQQVMEEKEKSHQEHVKQLSEKMERERAQLPEEQERTLALKLQEQSRLLQEGFPEKNR